MFALPPSNLVFRSRRLLPGLDMGRCQLVILGWHCTPYSVPSLLLEGFCLALDTMVSSVEQASVRNVAQ